MAEKIVSPGVFTNEKDLSFLPSGVAQIGAAIVGPTPKGPCFVPQIINNYEEFKAYYGDTDERYYVPYAVRSYLKSAGSVTIVRVVSEGGYSTGLVHILHSPSVGAPTAKTATFSTVTRDADTGSLGANIITSNGGAVATNFVKIAIPTASNADVGAGAIQTIGLTLVSASINLSGYSGVGFTSASNYVFVYTASAAAVKPTATFTLNLTEYSNAPYVIGTIAPTTTIGQSTSRDYIASTFPSSVPTTGSFAFTLSGSGITAQSLSGSIVTSAANNLSKVLGEGVGGPKNGYLYTYFDNYLNASTIAIVSGTITFESKSANTTHDLSSSLFGTYSPAYTPWVTSQLITGDTPARLFRIFTLSDGDAMNTSIKVSIINNTLAGQLPGTDYSSFTLLVREFGDSDQRPSVLETYSNLNLDPDSPNFISRRIGDRAFTVASTGEITAVGDYANISKYIRVSVTDAVKTKAASPSYNVWGAEAYIQTISSSFNTPPLALVTTNPVINNAYSTKAYYGWDFSNTDNLNYNKPIPNGAVQGSNTRFNLDSCLISANYGTKVDSNSTLTAGAPISASILRGQDVSNIAKFTLGFQGGFDGMDPAIPLRTGANITATNTVGLDCSSVTANGTLGYRKALNVLSNAESYDVSLIATPGVIADAAYHLSVTTKAIEVAEDRGDCFVLIDPTIQGTTVGQAVSAIANSGINTSYAATYWPWVKIMDMNRMKPIWVPPSVVLPRVIAQSDTAAFEWFAPAGLNRGGIQDAVDVEAKLSFSQRDTLYEARINPLATFPAQGVCVWGQKTLQTKASALDRINVRRLMITLKKYIASSSRYLVFENNTNETRQRFINIVTPYLENVKARQGLYAFRVVMDETNNTPDVIDRNQLYGQIYLQPAKTAEFIVLDFNILPTGATFDNA